MPMARECGSGAPRCSRTCTFTPSCSNSAAMNSPTGPAPTISTSVTGSGPVLPGASGVVQQQQIPERPVAGNPPALRNGGGQFGGGIAAPDGGQPVLPDVGAREHPGRGKEERVGGGSAPDVVVDHGAAGQHGRLGQEAAQPVKVVQHMVGHDDV